jgi:hypothetical protein
VGLYEEGQPGELFLIMAKEGSIEISGDPEPGRHAAVLDLRLDHGAVRRLPQVR